MSLSNCGKLPEQKITATWIYRGSPHFSSASLAFRTALESVVTEQWNRVSVRFPYVVLFNPAIEPVGTPFQEMRVC